MPQLDRIVPLVDAFASQRERIASRVLGLVGADLAGFDGWYSDALVAEVASEVAGQVLAGQAGTANLTDAYLARVVTLATDKATSPAGVAAGLSRSLRIGQPDLAVVYERLGGEFRARRAEGLTRAGALEATTRRASVMADTDLSLAFRRQVVDFNKRRGVERYRRVIRSEKPCGLCLAASDRLYRKANLLPLHGRCRCGVMPVTFTSDPGSTLSNDDLPALYEVAGGTSAAKLKRVTVEQHGELGPVLTVKGQRFRGPADVYADAA